MCKFSTQSSLSANLQDFVSSAMAARWDRFSLRSVRNSMGIFLPDPPPVVLIYESLRYRFEGDVSFKSRSTTAYLKRSQRRWWNSSLSLQGPKRGINRKTRKAHTTYLYSVEVALLDSNGAPARLDLCF